MKFNLGVYHKLGKDDKTAYASSFETSQKKSPMQLRMAKIKKRKKSLIQAWEDRNTSNQGTKLNK